MKRILLVSACLMLTAAPAMAQGSSDDRRGRDGGVEEMLRDLGHGGGGGGGASRSAGFFLRSGDATIAVRCDPLDSMKACVDATTALMEKARSMAPGGTTGATTTPPKP